MRLSFHLVLLFAAVCLLPTLACSQQPDETTDPSAFEREPLEAEVDFDRQTVVETSVLQFELRGTDRLPADSKSARVEFVGESGDFPDLETFYPARVSREGDVGDLTVELAAESSIWSELQPEDGAVFVGSITIEVYDETGLRARGAVDGARLTFRRNFVPHITSVDGGDVYVNQGVDLEGSGILRPDEGETIARIREGRLQVSGGESTDLSGEELAVRWTGARDEAELILQPDVLGIRPASFQVTLAFVNELSNGRTLSGPETIQVRGRLQKSYIAALSPSAASRGQWVGFGGRGFVPSGQYTNIGMYLRYEGRFEPDEKGASVRDLTGPHAIERTPKRVVAEDLIRQDVWYSVTDQRTLEGLGATPGRFTGTITPVLVAGSTEQQGIGWEGTFRVLPTKQLVYLKYLPAFAKALEIYGLRNVEGAIRDRVEAVVERDYADYHVEVREQKPDDFIDYATVEMGGPDPSGTRSFGYDNSFNGVAKDTGNLYLADYLGGVNAETAEEFHNPYGGIFISSFTFFSPTLSPDNPYASEKFDEILRPFMPKLGGKPVRGTEWPEGPRTDRIERAVRMVGSVIGNTVSHEVGHSLGMTFVKGDFDRPQNVFHNQIPGPFIMDAGVDREFEERAELGGAEPAGFNSLNKSYLDRVLPRPD